MKKPTKPHKPRKPKLVPPEQTVTEHHYLWYARKYNSDTKTWSEGYQFTRGTPSDPSADLPMIEEGGELYPDGDYAQAEDVPLAFILDWLRDNDIDPKDVTLANQVFYRKNDGQIVLEIKRRLSQAEYDARVARNQQAIQDYETKLVAYPALLEQYQTDKKRYDIWEAERRLRELKNT